MSHTALKKYDLHVQRYGQKLPLALFYSANAVHVLIWPKKVNAVKEVKDDFLCPKLTAALRLF